MALDEQRVAGGTSGFVSGATSGAVIGSVVPGIGTAVGFVVGGLLGGFAGALGAGSGRATFRANRRAEFFRNSALKLQASQITRVAGRLQSQQRAAAAGANLKGATITGVQVQALIDGARQRNSVLAGVSQEFQSGSGAVQPRDERASPATVRQQEAAVAEVRAGTRSAPDRERGRGAGSGAGPGLL